MKKFINTNDAYGMSGPFNAESREALADEMGATFRDWASEHVATGKISQDEMNQDIQDMRNEFIKGLEEV